MGFNGFILNIYIHIIHNQAFLVAQLVKNLPVMQETPVQILGWEDSLEGGHGNPFQYSWASLVAHTVKNPPVIWEMWV